MTNTPDSIVYTAHATVQGGRRGGHARTSDGLLEVDLQAPPEMGGPGGATNPEQLFAVGYGACFNGALRRVAQADGVDASACTTEVAVGFGPEGDAFALTVTLEVSIPGVDDATAQDLVEKAHQVCPYSRATRGNVPVTVIGKGA